MLKKLFLAYFLSLIMHSCSTLYNPNFIYIPEIKEKNETQIGGSLGYFLWGVSGNLFGGYRYAKHHTSYLSFNGLGNPKSYALYLELGNATFYSIGKNYSLGICTTIAIGNSSDRIESSMFYTSGQKFSGNYLKGSINPYFSFCNNSFTGIFNVRIGYFGYQTQVENNEYTPRSYYGYLIEPAVTSRFGKGKSKLILQAGVSIPIPGKNQSRIGEYNFNPFLAIAYERNFKKNRDDK